MKMTTLAACAVLLSVSQLCGAVQPIGMLPPVRTSSDADLVERGGTIDAVDTRQQAVVIDGTTYSIPVGSIRIHTSPNQVTGSLSELKPGMQVRFSSSTNASSNQPQMREVWVTSDTVRRLR